MDPHSRLSQFNARVPKAGPLLTSSRTMEATTRTTNPLEDFKKRSGQTRSRASSSSTITTVSRPIATNSRVKQDEQYHKDMYLAAINNALQQKTRGISQSFDELVNQFNPKQDPTDTPLPPAQLRLWIVALSHVVSRLERCHATLVEAVVGMPWTTMDGNFVKSYISFVGMLVSAKPEYLTVVLEKIASGLTYQSGLQALNAGMPETSSSPLTRRTVYERLHNLLQHLLSLIPTLPSALQPLLVRHFPHKRHNQAAQVTYIRNLLRVTEYCPELSDRILATIIDRAIQIDVEIQVEIEELEEQATNEQAEVFDLDPFDVLVGQEGESDSEDEESDDGDNFSDLSSDEGEADLDEVPPEEPTNVHHVQDMVNKLDAILKNVFEYFDNPRSKPSSPVPPPSIPSSQPDSTPLSPIEPRAPSPDTLEQEKTARRSQFYSLLSIFERTILRTFKSRYTQFLVFWYSSLDPEFSDLFQGMLVSKALLEEDQPTVTRTAAASYIASFVSRAMFVDRESARRVMACLCNFLSSRLEIFNAVTRTGAMPPSTAHHSIFYAVSQAVFLIFCFRWRDLQQEEDVEDELAAANGVPASKWMAELEVLPRAVQSELNPLKICSPNVVMQFARVAHATDFLYCYSIIEANRRSDFAPSPAQTPISSRPPARYATLTGASMHSELNTFFPFDPYRLPRSSSYIEGVYREWSAVAIDDDDDDDEDEDEDEEDEDLPNTHETATGSAFSVVQAIPVKSREGEGEANTLDLSFGGMSISPAPLSMSVAMSLT